MKAKKRPKMLWQARDRDGELVQFSKKPFYSDGMWLSPKAELDFPSNRACIFIDFSPLLGLFSKFSLRRIK